MEKVLIINKIVPARIFYYMYVYTDSGNYFVYAHRDKVNFFATHNAEDLSCFQDSVIKLTSFKYFNENSEQCAEKLKEIDFDNANNKKTRFGTCLINDKDINYKAEVWVDTGKDVIIFIIQDAGEYKDILTSDIKLPDINEENRLIEKDKKIEEAKNDHNYKVIELIKEQPKFFKRLISYGFPFKTNQLMEYSNHVNWKELSKNVNISWNIESIKEYKENIDWKKFSKYHVWKMDEIEEFKNDIVWKSFSLNTKVDWIKIIEDYENNISWKHLSKNTSFPWTKTNIIKFQDKIDWFLLTGNQNVKFEFDILKEFEHKIDWDNIATNQGNWWTKEIIDEFKDKIRWRNLLVYGTFWNEELIDYFKDYIKLDYGFCNLSENPNVEWNMSILEKYFDELGWGLLGENPGLPWNFELIEKYKDHWNWSYLGSIIWDIDYANEHINDFTRTNGTSALWTNKILIKDKDFCIKNKEILFPSGKGNGLMRGIDASANDELPVSIPFFYNLKDNLDWQSNLLPMLKRTGKYKNLIQDINVQILELFKETEHFVR